MASATSLPIDLQLVLRLAGAQNLDVQLARARLAEASAQHRSALLQLFPSISPGIDFRRREGQIQDVIGNLVVVDQQQIARGATLTARIDLGESLFTMLAERRRVDAAARGVDTQLQESSTAAAIAYYELLRTQVQVGVFEEAITAADRHADQLAGGVEAGLVFRGDALRVQTQAQRFRGELAGAQAQRRIASARLAQLLRLDPAVDLEPDASELVPVALPEADVGEDIATLVDSARTARPESGQTAALAEAARDARRAAIYGPLVPALGVQVFGGELGGGLGNASGNFASSRDYQVSLRWRIGPGGLFDRGRIDAATARLEAARIGAEKIGDEIARDVVESAARVQAHGEQVRTTRQMLEAATETFRLTRDRRQLGVGVVLEDIQAQQELVRARADHAAAVAGFNASQYALRRALGRP